MSCPPHIPHSGVARTAVRGDGTSSPGLASVTTVGVRDLTGEDLTTIEWVDERARLRCLGEASAVTSGTDELDYLAACDGERIVGIGAVSHGAGSASLASVALDPGRRPAEVVPLLVDSLERRAASSDPPSMRLHVAADDLLARELYEDLGYEVVGAGTLWWCEDDGDGGETVRHVDSWVLTKALTRM